MRTTDCCRNPISSWKNNKHNRQQAVKNNRLFRKKQTILKIDYSVKQTVSRKTDSRQEQLRTENLSAYYTSELILFT